MLLYIIIVVVVVVVVIISQINNNGCVTSVAKKINNELLTKSIIATFILYQKQKYKGQNILGIFVSLGTINTRGRGQTVLGYFVLGDNLS